MPAPKQRVISVIPVLLFLLIGYATYIAATSGRDAKHSEAAQAQKDADWHRTNDAQWALAKSLSTPQTFQARCGAASSLVRGIMAADARDFDGVPRHNITTLVYKMPPAEEMHVIFTGTKDAPGFRAHVHQKMYSLVPYDGLVEMGCVGKLKN